MLSYKMVFSSCAIMPGFGKQYQFHAIQLLLNLNIAVTVCFTIIIFQQSLMILCDTMCITICVSLK